jgi:hypothetical protein
MAYLTGLVKEAAIQRVVAQLISVRGWRSEAEKEAMAYLQRNEKSRKSDVIAYVREAYNNAGAGFSGRWQ